MTSGKVLESARSHFETWQQVCTDSKYQRCLGIRHPASTFTALNAMLLSRVVDALSLRLNNCVDLSYSEYEDELEMQLLEVICEPGISNYRITESRRLAQTSV